MHETYVKSLLYQEEKQKKVITIRSKYSSRYIPSAYIIICEMKSQIHRFGKEKEDKTHKKRHVNTLLYGEEEKGNHYVCSNIVHDNSQCI